jgi:hypothetical protein
MVSMTTEPRRHIPGIGLFVFTALAGFTLWVIITVRMIMDFF